MLADLSANGWLMLLWFTIGSVIVFNILYGISDHYIKKHKLKAKR